MFEFTKSNKHKKSIADKKGKYTKIKDFILPKLNSITGIIHRLNYFDVLILTVVIVALVFLIHNRIQRKSEWINIRVVVQNADWWYKGSSPEYWYAADLKQGELAKDSFGNTSAEITKIENYDNGGPYRNIYLNLKLRVDYDKKRNQYLYEYKPLAVGSFVTFNFSDQLIQGLIASIGEDNVDYYYKTVKLKGYTILPELANKIKTGDKSLDNNGNLVAEILDVKSTVSSSNKFSDIRGLNIKTFDSDYRDVEVTTKLKVYSRLGLDFFVNNAAIKTGLRIWIQFPKYSLEDYKILNVVE